MFLIGNGRMITRDNAAPYLENGCVAVENGVITEVGATGALRAANPGSEFLDAKGGVIMPGLINMHNHIYSAFARGLSIGGYSPKSFREILEGLWWRLDRALNLDDTYLSAMATYVDCIKNGVTTVFDHHASYGAIEGSLFKISDAAVKLGVRTCLCYEVSDRDGQEKMRAAVKENADYIRTALQNGDDMRRGMMGLHASFTLSDETLEYCVSSTPSGTGFHIHVAEGPDDQSDSLEKYKKRTVERLFERDILGTKTIACHCIHIDSNEMELLKKTDTMVVHNPESNMGNAVGCPAVLEQLKRGIMTGLGTDGYTNDMLESYKAANLLHKHNTGDPNAAWGEVPQMLFANNAAMANRYFKKPLGVLKAGAAADVIITDYNPLTPMDAGNCNGHILFGMNGRSVVSTVIDGRVLMKDRVLVDADEQKIMADSRQQAQSLWDRVNQ